MTFEPGNLYHVYNRGNNKQLVFFNNENYLHFLRKVRQYLLPTCNILAYTLMPNHFHFLIEADARTVKIIPNSDIPKNAFSEGIRLMLSSYTKGINKQRGLTGNLFQQKTKSKIVFDGSVVNPSTLYAKTCFHYIHQNAWRARLSSDLIGWAYSSLLDYSGIRDGTLCNKLRAAQIFDLKEESFIEESMAAIPEQYLEHIW